MMLRMVIPCLLALAGAGSVRAQPSDLNREARSILSAHCFTCHGPDSKARKANLRLDLAEAAQKDCDGLPAITPKNLEKSEVWRRITNDDPTKRMPPASAKKSLTAKEIDVLKRWIEAGAASDRHWAFAAPKRPAPPTTANKSWSRSPLDHFVLARIEAEKLTPSPAAEPERWLRRVSLDLVGLPPAPKEIDDFLSEDAVDSNAARAKVADRLLASPRFGERWAAPWLDQARYADSNGYQADQLREIWAYRDWVIRALNDDMPFDRFVVEQLAGDLMPNATMAQKIASGFHRTVTCNVEAGVNPEENRVNQVFDRVNTTATVFLGLSFECAQCHHHKYDPVSMKDYYQLFAYFNNTPLEVELPKGKGVQYELAGPKMTLPRATIDIEKATRIQADIDRLNGERKRLAAETPESEATKKSQAASLKKLDQRLKTLARDAAALRETTTLIMVEMDTPRATHILNRGNYLTPGDKVDAGIPAALHPIDPTLPKNRLGLARWLTSRDNPLLARVTVNRWWAELFSRGIVPTSEEFGSQGDMPTHPDLLDWLAVEFMDSGWSMKHLLKQIVLSSTYGQSSRVTPSLLERDPENKLLARGSRFRLRAETIRDQGLVASGLLSDKMFGPPVMPYQPPGLWKTVGRNSPIWTEAIGEDRFRRGVYVVWRRAMPYPSFVAFDAPDRSACVVKRSRTNTPLQALALLNDPAYLEMALALACRIQTMGKDDDERLRHAWRLLLTRTPSAAELEVLGELLRTRLDDYRANPKKAAELVQGIRGFRPPADVDPARVAAWFHVANVLFNLDEAITR